MSSLPSRRSSSGPEPRSLSSQPIPATFAILWTRAFGMTRAPLLSLFPDALGDSGVAILDAVVQIKSGDRTQRLVVQHFLSQGLFEVFLEIVEGLQVVRQRRLILPAGSAEEFLIAAIHQGADLIAHQDSSAAGTHLAGSLLQVDGAGLFFPLGVRKNF